MAAEDFAVERATEPAIGGGWPDVGGRIFGGVQGSTDGLGDDPRPSPSVLSRTASDGDPRWAASTPRLCCWLMISCILFQLRAAPAFFIAAS